MYIYMHTCMHVYMCVRMNYKPTFINVCLKTFGKKLCSVIEHTARLAAPIVESSSVLRKKHMLSRTVYTFTGLNPSLLGSLTVSCG